MADIKISRKHSLDESELRLQLEKLADEMANKFGIRSDFQPNGVRLSGNLLRNGAVSWTSDTLSIELTLVLMGKMFKHPIKKAIEERMHLIVAS